MRRCLALLLVGCSLALFSAASSADDIPAPSSEPPAAARPHAPMEVFGVGPELFDNRASAWVDAAANVSDKAVARLGALAIAIVLGIQNFKLKTGVKDRLDKQRSDIDHVSAVAGTVPPSQAAIVTPAPITP